LPARTQEVVTEDLTVISRGAIEIDGDLVLSAPFGNEAPDLVLISTTTIIVRGRILGSRGRDAELEYEQGGAGSSILLDAPQIWIDGEVRGGNGGAAGPRGKGGSGGDIDIVGSYLTHGTEPAARGAFGGDGGTAGFPGGDGGDGGDVTCF
jgi:hypothetical protein